MPIRICVYINRAGLNYKHTNIVASLQDFLSAIFDTLLYQLNDALSRLGKVKRYETDKEGERCQGTYTITCYSYNKINMCLLALYNDITCVADRVLPTLVGGCGQPQPPLRLLLLYTTTQAILTTAHNRVRGWECYTKCNYMVYVMHYQCCQKLGFCPNIRIFELKICLISIMYK